MKFRYVVYHITGAYDNNLSKFDFEWSNNTDWITHKNNFNSEQEALEFIEEHWEAIKFKLNTFTILREIV